jgi:hypothetical protein
MCSAFCACWSDCRRQNANLSSRPTAGLEHDNLRAVPVLVAAGRAFAFNFPIRPQNFPLTFSRLQAKLMPVNMQMPERRQEKSEIGGHQYAS